MKVALPYPIPTDISICPYCGQPLLLMCINEYCTDSENKIEITDIQIDCSSINTMLLKRYIQTHDDMPYVKWLPVETRVLEWVNKSELFKEFLNES